MNTNKSAPCKNGANIPLAYLQETRPGVRKSARTTYGVLRIFLVLYGGLIAYCFLRMPFDEKVLVPDFALAIFMILLTLLAVSEVWLRMAEHSCKLLPLPGEIKGGDCADEKTPLLLRFAFWIFPYQGIHLGLLTLWFFLAVYYLFLCGLGITGGITICPENFLLSFYAVAVACIFDYITKSVFIFRVPGLSGLVVEFANTAIRSEGNIGGKILDGLIKIFQKLSFKKGR